MDLAGKVAVVTGGAVRLGKAFALALAEQGVHLGLHYGASGGAADETVAEIRALGVEALAIQADLRQAKEAAGVIRQAASHFGRIDILINSAAVFEPGDILSTTEANWDQLFAVNLKSPFFLSQAFAAEVGRERAAHIVNVADARASRAGADYLAYRLTKAALITMTRSLALALAPNIQVNALAPGAILPPPGKGPDYLQALAKGIPAQRAGSADEVVRALLFLLRSDFVTGEVIHLSGGAHL